MVSDGLENEAMPMRHNLSMLVAALMAGFAILFVFRPPPHIPRKVEPTGAACDSPPDFKLAPTEYNCETHWHRRGLSTLGSE